MATLKDVAKLACCDISTVSRALNNTSYVHPETKERILKAVKELSYTPNVLAKGLRQGKRHTIGIVVPRLHLTMFAAVVEGIEKKARDLGYSTLICNTEDDPKLERECLNRLRNGFVDGIIIASTGENNRLIKDISAQGLVVTQVVRDQDSSLNSVIADFHKCGYEGVKYLHSIGCKKIGFINGSMKIAPYKERYNGFKKAIKEFKLKEICAISKGSIHSMEYGYECTLDLLEEHKDLDAIMVSVDAQGIGALRALKEKRIKVPKQIKLLSLTGHVIGTMLETTMSSLEVPSVEIGTNAARITIEEIETKEKLSPKHLVFLPSLVLRESC